MDEISKFVDIRIDISRNGKIEIFRVWYASIDLSRPRIRTRVPSLVDIFHVDFELRPTLVPVSVLFYLYFMLQYRYRDPLFGLEDFGIQT